MVGWIYSLLPAEKIYYWAPFLFLIPPRSHRPFPFYFSNSNPLFPPVFFLTFSHHLLPSPPPLLPQLLSVKIYDSHFNLHISHYYFYASYFVSFMYKKKIYIFYILKKKKLSTKKSFILLRIFSSYITINDIRPSMSHQIYRV